ncbi:MAG TPA: patatin-like phospholipase family protein [Candidatus Dormibacteraeota bacterium]|jgi:NTE family protein|nr:patatin-like phospholipase family protein [Candidatus Dormibacteraeota bacterium]
MKDSSGKSAIILSGGGAYGAYEIGVMRSLFNGMSPATNYQPFDPDIFTGTSAGAFNAGLVLSAGSPDLRIAVEYAADVYLSDIGSSNQTCGNGVLRLRGFPLSFIEEGCYRNNPLRPFAEFAEDMAVLANSSVNRIMRFMNSKGSMEQRIVELVDLETFMDTQSFRRVVESRVFPERIRRCQKIIQIMTTNWITGDLRVFGADDMNEEIGRAAIMASSAIPSIFPTVEIQNQPYADGGLVMNTALRPPVEAGADELHVIYVDPSPSSLPLSRLRSTATTVYRMMVITLAAMLDRDIEIAGRINQGIKLIEEGERGEIPEDPEMKALSLIIGSLPLHLKTGLPYRKLTIHRYHPGGDPGGPLRWLSFDRDHLEALIDRGMTDAARHDCVVNGCVLPEGPATQGAGR